MLVSHDAGTTWRESGRGLPPGTAVAIADCEPRRARLRGAEPALRLARRRRLLDGARRRAARDRGGRAQGILNSPRATITAEPPTRTRSIRSPVALDARRRASTAGRSRRPARSRSPRRRRSGRGGRDGSRAGPAAEPVAGSSGTPCAGANMRVFQRPPSRAKQLTPASRHPRERAEVGLERGRPARASRARRRRGVGPRW